MQRAARSGSNVGSPEASSGESVSGEPTFARKCAQSFTALLAESDVLSGLREVLSGLWSPTEAGEAHLSDVSDVHVSDHEKDAGVPPSGVVAMEA